MQYFAIVDMPVDINHFLSYLLQSSKQRVSMPHAVMFFQRATEFGAFFRLAVGNTDRCLPVILLVNTSYQRSHKNNFYLDWPVCSC